MRIACSILSRFLDGGGVGGRVTAVGEWRRVAGPTVMERPTLFLGQEKYQDAVTTTRRPPRACGCFWTVWGKIQEVRCRLGLLLALGPREAQDKWLKCKTNSTYYVNERMRPPSSRRVRACRRDSQGKLCIAQANSLCNQADTNPRRHGRHHPALLGGNMRHPS